jgi:hypothetical protein
LCFLGLEKVHELTTRKRYRLRVDLTDFSGAFAYAEYDYFVVGDVGTNFRLISLGEYSGTAGQFA